MSISANSSILKKPKERYFAAFGLAFIMACILFIPHIIIDKGYFVYYGDFNAQQIPFYKLAHAAVRNLDIGWDFGTDLGANFMSSYSFYLLGSPFFWLTLPFPNSFIPHLMGPLLILKFSCASLTAYAFITKFVKNKTYALLGGIMYAFSGFSVYNIFFNHFHEAIIYFPLLLLGLELIMAENRRGLFFLAVALSSISNYYFFFGMVIFTVIYFVVRWASGSWNITFKRGEAAYTCSRFLGVIIESVLGLCASMFILLPAVLGIMQNSRVGSMIMGWNSLIYDEPKLYPYIIQCLFFPPDPPARMVYFDDIGVKKWASVAAWLPLFGMVGTLSFMKTRRKSWQTRLLALCLLIAFVPVLNQAFSAFNYNYYARWFYMPVLILSLTTVMAFEDKNVDLTFGLKWSAIVTAIVVIAIGFIPAKQDGQGNIIEYGVYNKNYTERFWIYAAVTVACLAIVFMLIKVKKKSARIFARSALALCCVISVLYSSYVVYLGTLVRTNAQSFIIPTLIENDRQLTVTNAQNKLELACELDDARIDVYESTQNTAMYLGFSSIQAFQSIVPGSIMDFYKYTAFNRTVNSNPSPDIYALRGLLSVKYVINYTGETKQFYSNGKYAAEGYKLYSPNGPATTKQDTEQSGYYVYENTNFVPYGFTYDSFMSEAFCDQVEKEQRSNAMMKAILLDDEQIEKYSDILSDISETADIEGFKNSLTYDEYVEDCKARAAASCSSFETGKSEFTAKITLDKDNLVFFSVPFEEGWSAEVDGKPVDIEKVNVGFMAVKVSGDGTEHTIHFTYRTPGFKPGIVISCAAVLLFAAYFVIYKKKFSPGFKDCVGSSLDEQKELDVMSFSREAGEGAGNAPPAENDGQNAPEIGGPRPLFGDSPMPKADENGGEINEISSAESDEPKNIFIKKNERND